LRLVEGDADDSIFFDFHIGYPLSGWLA
jgi:hypothetical protein